MESLKAILVWIGLNFTSENYLVFTKIQGVTWSLADIVLVYYFLKISDLARKQSEQKPIRFRYYLLFGTVLLTPILIFARTSRQIFFLESIICGSQYLILIFSVLYEKTRLIELFKRYLNIIGV